MGVVSTWDLVKLLQEQLHFFCFLQISDHTFNLKVFIFENWNIQTRFKQGFWGSYFYVPRTKPQGSLQVLGKQ